MKMLLICLLGDFPKCILRTGNEYRLTISKTQVLHHRQESSHNVQDKPIQKITYAHYPFTNFGADVQTQNIRFYYSKCASLAIKSHKGALYIFFALSLN